MAKKVATGCPRTGPVFGPPLALLGWQSLTQHRGETMKSAYPRYAAILMIFVVLLVFGPPASASASGYWFARGRVMDSESGLPARGVTYVVYAYDPYSKDLVCDGYGSVDSQGRYYGHIPDYRPWAVVCFGGRGTFYDTFWGGLRTGFMVDYASRHDTSVLPYSGDLIKAKRLYRDHDGTAYFSDQWLDLIPRPNGLISGSVVDAYSGTTMSTYDTTVWKYDIVKGAWAPAGWREETNSDGSFVWPGSATFSLLGGIRLQYHIYTSRGWVDSFYPNASTVDDAVTLDLKEGDIVRGLYAQVAVPNRLRGTVMRTESKTPLVDAKVAEVNFDAASGTWNIGGGPDSDESGDYCLPYISGLAPGDYKVRVFDRSGTYDTTYYGQTTDMDRATAVRVEQGDVIDGVDIWMSDHAAVAGTVLDEQGVRRSDVRVTAYRRNADGSFSNIGTDYTDAYGRYRVLVNSAGTYTIRYTDRAGTLQAADDYGLYLGGASTIASATTVRVSSRMATVPAPFRLTAVIDPAAERIAGTSDCGSAIASSKSGFDTAPVPTLPSSLRLSRGALPASLSAASAVGTPTVVITARGHYAEAICAQGLAGAVNGPVLLTNATSFHPNLLPELKRLGTRQIYVVGGTTTVSDRQLRLLRALGYSVERVTGTGAYQLSANVARKIAAVSTVTSATPVFVTTSGATADGMIVAPAAYAAHGIVLFTTKSSTPASIVSAVKSLGLKRAYAVGDKYTVTSSSISGLKKAGMTVSRGNASTSAYTRAASFASAASARHWLGTDAAGLVSLSSMGQSITCPGALGRMRAPLLFVSKTTLPAVTADLLKRRSATLKTVRLFSKTSTVSATVLLAAGSY